MSPQRKRLLCLLPPALGLLALAAKDWIRALTRFFPPCDFLHNTGYLCPGCGNTRSVLHLLWLDIPRSLQYNITPFLTALLCAAFYIELVLWAFGRHRVIVPRKPWFWGTAGACMLVYFAARNFVPWLAFPA